MEPIERFMLDAENYFVELLGSLDKRICIQFLILLKS